MNQTASEINIAATDQSGNLRAMMMDNVNDTKRTFQPSDANNDESRMTEQPSTDRQRWGRPAQQPMQAQANVLASQDGNLWDDPDMVPVPVLPQFSENSIHYEAHDVHNPAMRTRNAPPSSG